MSYFCKACQEEHSECPLETGEGLSEKRKRLYGQNEVQLIFKKKPIIKFYEGYLHRPDVVDFLLGKTYFIPDCYFRVVYSKKKDAHFMLDSATEEWVAKIYDMKVAYKIINRLKLGYPK